MFDKYVSTPIIPVAVVETEEEIRKIADFSSEYLPSIELTMRTEYAYKALEILSKDYSNLAVAAATVISPEQADRILDLGINLIISPGFQPIMLEHAKNKGYNYIPGVATPSELEQCLYSGYKYLKFFHAGVFGGIEWLKGVGTVYSHTGVKFMPLGGVSIDNVLEYLKLPNVFACGGSWLCPRNLLSDKNWKEIKKRFETASNLIKELK
ncbi:bifunctional 4-hydroxy-2-oxoglutarate aldolase/2-dehydro-3-deoxy-phosphogluconate aldolase [Brachyspira catarrhinii]|uniref:Bifunctional 4-hydroxy-2-oxoglutarate aldolase/2-dehydro-3-deoxy-phosphogluconate aldolase n=1 Tax=Brachyspira catarrhinii TaxID=2528966 RepID=A0ABY2TYL5_9SPIR|nr:bifunctional 4-hydroxy-2-oxoglutarate aldolase/2-dehydro-3-deoxy-phosphogluconate aldolase [Brachyspira catarrhinii]TKZ36447.1 bifunctional 4-hydroxy-2-oxoglutarate aldolase/2-dehydro-3-deoxy-phosphogluconate aldolase [Brachyspira catarrhinii]